MSAYAARFAENKVGIPILPDLTDRHLNDLDIALGDRLQMLGAVRKPDNASVAEQRRRR